MSERGDGAVGWEGRVAFTRDGSAYRPSELLVTEGGVDLARELCGCEAVDRGGAFVRLAGVDDPVALVSDLRIRGHHAQLNHVLFAHCGCCCGPHPAAIAANPFQANPFQANPFQANPFQANPWYAAQWGGATAAVFQATGSRPHSARPATAPALPRFPGDLSSRHDPRIVVIDTGLAASDLRPHALDGLSSLATAPDDERPDEDADGSIDPVAGHGTFIAGMIERIAPGCRLHVDGLLTGYGDATEFDLAARLDALRDDPPHLLSLSFGGYAPANMDRLGEAVRALQQAGVVIVASAGNDATCRPAYPAAFPGVIAVGALGPWGPAPFTNYGSWVRACAPGVDVVSTFFTKWSPPSGSSDDRYAEWVSWSGTSFAAPAVTGALARAMCEGASNTDAVTQVIDAPALLRIPQLGTVVNEHPRWSV